MSQGIKKRDNRAVHHSNHRGTVKYWQKIKNPLLSQLKGNQRKQQEENEGWKNTRLDSGGIWVRARMSGNICVNN